MQTPTPSPASPSAPTVAGRAEVMLARPEKANALDAAHVATLRQRIAEAIASEPTVLVVHSACSAFCGGLDLTHLEDETDATLLARLVEVELLLAAIRSAPCVTVAVVAGPAYGAGADLALACDHRVGTTAARFRFPGSRFGIVLGTSHLRRVVGGDATRALAVQGRTLTAAEALQCGLLTELTDDPNGSVASLADGAAQVPRESLAGLLAATRVIDPDSDLAALVRSATVPGLVGRISAYRASLTTLS